MSVDYDVITLNSVYYQPKTMLSYNDVSLQEHLPDECNPTDLIDAAILISFNMLASPHDDVPYIAEHLRIYIEDTA